MAKDIVGYDQDKQAGALLKWLNISSIMQQIVWLAGSAITVMSILALMIWQRRRKRWHPADLPLARLSKRLGKREKSLSRHDNEGQLAWLERLSATLNSVTGSTNAASTNSKLATTILDKGNPESTQRSIDKIKENYRQLRYGKISTLKTNDCEYQQALQQLRQNVQALL